MNMDKGLSSSWTSNTDTTNSAANNSTLLLIAVEYVKSKYESSEPNFNEFTRTLDPNMSSTARYSPVYSDVVVSSTSDPTTTPPPPPSSLSNQQHQQLTSDSIQEQERQQIEDDDNNYLVHTKQRQQKNDLGLVHFPISDYHNDLKIDPERVELLITDQNTGISYSGYVPQDFIIGRTPTLSGLQEDQEQLTNVLNTLVMEESDEIASTQAMLQDPLLDSDLLLQAPGEMTLDDTTDSLVLKSNLNVPEDLSANEFLTDHGTNIKIEVDADDEFHNIIIDDDDEDEEDVNENNGDDFFARNVRRSQRFNEKRNQMMEDETQFLNRVQTISDKPVLSRARATLPASYLVINKLPSKNPNTEPEYGVFARKAIPKRTQFGPLEGMHLEYVIQFCFNGLELLLESETGAMHTIDISDENLSNWMRFVRPARTYNEQNLVLSQQGYSLYYTTTRVILPRQELLVGYSTTYASKRKLETLKPLLDDKNGWPCFECPLKFMTSEELQKHLNVHDEYIKEDFVPKLKRLHNLKRIKPIQCSYCPRTFLRRYSYKRHLLQHSNARQQQGKQHQQQGIRSRNLNTVDTQEIQKWKCDQCNLYFPNSSLLNIHELVHRNGSDETITGLPLDLGSGCHEGEFLVHNGSVQCPECSTEYLNRKLLIEHVSQHGRNYVKVVKNAFKCSLCYKTFASSERLQRHMLVHGSDESKPIKCDKCSKRFLNNSALACHIKTQHKTQDKKIFECPICKVSFDQILQLKLHVQMHCIDGLYNCPHCQKTFKEYSIIRKHIRAFHCDRKHMCQYCGKPFPTLDKLRMHLLKHSDHREFLCSVCGKQFKRKDKLKEHMKRMHSDDRRQTEDSQQQQKKIKQQIVKNGASAAVPSAPGGDGGGGMIGRKFMPKVQPTDYHRFIYKCHNCLLGFKRRGMLVNHLAKRHPDISPDSVPELNLPILKTTRDYYCQYCDKVYKSSSKRKAHILKIHPGAELPLSNRQKGGIPDIPGVPNPTFSQTVGSVTTNPHSCQWCHKQYASKAKLLQHQRKKHTDCIPPPNSNGGEKRQQQHIEKTNDVERIDENQLLETNANVSIPTDMIAIQSFEQDNAFCSDIEAKQHFKFTDETLVDDLTECHPSETISYYRLIHLQADVEQVDDPPEPSRLYRLLSDNNGPFPPYPPR